MIEKHRALENYFIVAGAILILVLLSTVLITPSNPSQNGVKSCNNIVLSNYRDSCILSYAENTSSFLACNLLPNNTKYPCINNIAEKTQNLSLCNRRASPVIGAEKSCMK